MEVETSLGHTVLQSLKTQYRGGRGKVGGSLEIYQGLGGIRALPQYLCFHVNVKTGLQFAFKRYDKDLFIAKKKKKKQDKVQRTVSATF